MDPAFCHLNECLKLLNSDVRCDSARTGDIARYITSLASYRYFIDRYRKFHPLMREITQRMIDMIEEHECKDIECVSDIFLAYHLMHHGMDIPYKRTYALNMCYAYQFDKKSILTDIFTKPYGSTNVKMHRSLDVVKIALLNGNFGILPKLLKFGAILLQPDDDLDEWNNTRKVLNMLFSDHCAVYRESNDFFQGSLLQNFNPDSRKRLFLVMLVLEIFAEVSTDSWHLNKIEVEQKKYDVGRCIQLAFDSIPEPLISIQEIQICLEKLLRGKVPKKYIRLVSREYEDLFPGSLKHKTPRSLQHLCRCKVRQAFRETGNLPRGIDSLALSENLKNYLKLDIQ